MNNLLNILYIDERAIGGIAVGLVIVILLFLLLREFFCWYYKINQGLRELRQLNANIKLMVKAQGGNPWENNGKRETPIEEKKL